LEFRIGTGADVHQFVEGRPLILGGVVIPHDRGLAGHSDADVLLHALTDAILGALGWGDIGAWFPDTEQKYKNADSSELLSIVWDKVTGEGWTLNNTDITVLMQSPRLRTHIDHIRDRIASILGVETGKVSVKATTTERLGFIGREEGIFCEAVVLLARENASS
jgi:2-C-methyl-D-erythritol 2,4-cyclodiphosphate synthase